MKRAVPVFSMMILLLTSLARAQNAPTTQPISGSLGKPIELFNGKDLAGWVWFTPNDAAKMDEVFTVKDGLLHCRGTPNGYLHTEKDFDNYLLTVEQRHTKPGNGGIFFALSGPDKIWPKCLEMQGQAGGEGHIRGVADFKLNMDPARIGNRQLNRIGPASTKPIGEWDTIVIINDHNKVFVEVNGKLQNLTTSNESLAGKIAIQVEGGEMEFRKLQVTPIEAK